MFRIRFFVLILFSFFFVSISNFKSVNLSKQNGKQQIENLYKDVSGFGIDTSEVNEIRSQGGAPTYGEIEYDSVQKLLNILKLTKKDVFYDLGSGVGKFVVQAYLNTPVKKSIGIELSSTRHNGAQKVQEKLIKQKKLRRRRKLEFKCENITNSNLKDATVVFMCSTCFSDELMRQLTKKFIKLKKGLKIITLKDLPENNNFKLLKQYTLPMTWSDNSTVYIYELIKTNQLKRS